MAYNVLVVDDEPLISGFIKKRLSIEAPHLSITALENGRDCLEYVARNRVDCILSDYQMPGMNGIELLIRLKEQGGDIPFIFVTGQGSEEIAREAFKQGASDYFTKDIGFAHFPRIINSIEQAIAHHKAKADKAEAETEVESARADWERTFNVITDIVTLHDRDFTIVKANRAAVAAFGKTAEELVGMKCYELFHRDGEPVAGCPSVELMKTGAVSTTHEVSAHGRLFEVRVYPVRDDGEITSFVHVAKDITEQRTYQELLKDEKSRLEVILDSIPDGICIVDTNYRVVYQNPALKTMMGEHVGEYCYAAFEGRKDICEGCPVEKAYRNGDTHSAERVVEVGGHERHFSLTASVLRDDDGNIVAGIEVVRDISEKSRAEAEIAFERAQMLSLVENLSEIVYVSDPLTYEVLFANRALREKFNADPVGSYCYDVLQGLDAPCQFCTNEKILKNRGEVFKWEHYNPVLKKDLLVEDRIIKWPDGRDVRFEVAIDITDRKNFERQKADFYAMITHDLKSPLTAIIGYQELIRHRLKDSDDRDLLEMSMAVERSADKLMNMVEDYLALSHYESGKLKLLKGTVDVGRILHDVAGEFSITARRAGQELVLDISGDLPDILADGRFIDRALHNLLSNAVSYTPRGGRITLGARRLTEGDGVLLEISVSDTGPGIAPADRDKLFEKYYRASKSAGIKGAGLGLAIVKAVADAHGGRVELDTEEGKGSTFRIIIPADRERRAGNLEESAA